MNNTKEKRIQLNEEPVVNCVNTVVKHQKEENGMKKTRKYVAMLTSIIMVLSIMAGCSDTQVSTGGVSPSTSIGSGVEPTTQAPTEVAVQPTEEAVPTEEATPTEEVVAPTEEVAAPTESTDPNVIDGIDFNKYYTGEVRLDAIMEEVTLDSARVMVCEEIFTNKKRVEAILADGDKFTCQNDLPDQHIKFYRFAVYTPKKAIVTPITSEETVKFFMQNNWNDDAGNIHDGMYYFELPTQPLDSEVELSFKVEYEDGSEETITVYITKDFETYS
jgi:hypothetical protein